MPVDSFDLKMMHSSHALSLFSYQCYADCESYFSVSRTPKCRMPGVGVLLITMVGLWSLPWSLLVCVLSLSSKASQKETCHTLNLLVSTNIFLVFCCPLWLNGDISTSKQDIHPPKTKHNGVHGIRCPGGLCRRSHGPREE